MPFDPTIAIIFGSLLLALLACLLYAAWYQKFTYQTSRRGEEEDARSIGLSELEGLIRKAVAEATRPMGARVARLEAELQALQDARPEEPEGLLAEREAPLLRLPDEDPDVNLDAAPLRTPGRRVR